MILRLKDERNEQKLPQRGMGHEHNFLSVCCGADANEYVENICAACREFTGFECECGEIK